MELAEALAYVRVDSHAAAAAVDDEGLVGMSGRETASQDHDLRRGVEVLPLPDALEPFVAHGRAVGREQTTGAPWWPSSATC